MFSNQRFHGEQQVEERMKLQHRNHDHIYDLTSEKPPALFRLIRHRVQQQEEALAFSCRSGDDPPLMTCHLLSGG